MNFIVIIGCFLIFLNNLKPFDNVAMQLDTEKESIVWNSKLVEFYYSNLSFVLLSFSIKTKETKIPISDKRHSIFFSINSQPTISMGYGNV